MGLRTVTRAGLAAVALLVPISLVLALSDYPFADASSDDLIRYFDGHRTAFMVATLLELVSISLLLVFVAGVAQHVPTGIRLLTASAGTGTVLLIGLEVTTLAAGAFQRDPDAVRTLWPLAQFGVGVLVHVATTLFVGAATVGLAGIGGPLDDGRSGRWRAAVAVSGTIATAGNAGVPFGYLGKDVDALAGMIEHIISTLPFALWVAVSSTAMLVRKPFTIRE